MYEVNEREAHLVCGERVRNSFHRDVGLTVDDRALLLWDHRAFLDDWREGGCDLKRVFDRAETGHAESGDLGGHAGIYGEFPQQGVCDATERMTQRPATRACSLGDLASKVPSPRASARETIALLAVSASQFQDLRWSGKESARLPDCCGGAAELEDSGC